ncbi:hypothetical protein N8787_02700 [Opitutaceae bacterium]|nr:hypothetical protein [Opitutaceae bacterium]
MIGSRLWPHKLKQRPDGSVIIEYGSPRETRDDEKEFKPKASRVSRQLKWQREKKKNGLCTQCGKRPTDNALCPPCREKAREKNLKRHRLIAGIPLDAPLGNQGRPRIEQ